MIQEYISCPQNVQHFSFQKYSVLLYRTLTMQHHPASVTAIITLSNCPVDGDLHSQTCQLRNMWFVMEVVSGLCVWWDVEVSIYKYKKLMEF